MSDRPHTLYPLPLPILFTNHSSLITHFTLQFVICNLQFSNRSSPFTFALSPFPPRFSNPQSAIRNPKFLRVQRTSHPSSAFIQNMRINHRGPHVLMAEKFLHSPNIVSIFQQMRRKAMPKCVARPILSHSRFAQ